MYSTMFNIVENLKIRFKQLLESMLLSERKEHLQRHTETKGNGFYTRSVATKYGTIEKLKVPRARDGSFKSQFFSTRHTDSELEDLVTELFIEDISTRRIEGILQKCFGTSLSHGSIANIARAGID